MKRKAKPKKIVVEFEDPLFGKLTWDDIDLAFVGQMMTPLSEKPLIIHVEAEKETGPSEQHRMALEEVFDLVPKLEREILQALCQIWEEIAEGVTKEVFSAAEIEAELGGLLELTGIFVSIAHEGCELKYKFKQNFWPEQSLFVQITEGHAFPAGSSA